MSAEKSKMLPYQRGEFVKSFREKNDRIDRELFIKILETGGISREGENITHNDLFSVPKELSLKELHNLIAVTLEIEQDSLENNLEKISECFRDAKAFLEKYLLQGMPKEIQKIEEFKNSGELTSFMKRAKTLSNGDPMTFSPIVCSLMLITIAEWEYRKENFQYLKKESEHLDEKLFKRNATGVSHFHEIRKKEDEEWSEIGIFTDEQDWINATYSFRGKEKDSVINKILQKPEVNAKEIIKDGIGLKFEVKTKEDAEKLIAFLSRNLQINFETNKLLFSNVGDLMNQDEIKAMKNYLKEYNIGILDQENPASSKNFQALKIEGEIKLPENGEEGRKMVSRNFEIQVVLTDNKNETGLIQNSIYKRIQKLSTYTRLFGSFSEKYLDLICEEASKVSSLGQDKIKKYIKEKFLLKIFDKKTKKPKFGSKEQVERWRKSGFLPKDITAGRKQKK